MLMVELNVTAPLWVVGFTIVIASVSFAPLIVFTRSW
jgi:hypothetical protein